MQKNTGPRRYWGYILITAGLLIGFGVGLLTGYPGSGFLIGPGLVFSGPRSLTPWSGWTGLPLCRHRPAGRAGCCAHRDRFYRLWHGDSPGTLAVHHRRIDHPAGDPGPRPRLCKALLHFPEKMNGTIKIKKIIVPWLSSAVPPMRSGPGDSRRKSGAR